MKITYLGTTVLLFDDGKNKILFDAYFSRYPLFKAFLGKLSTDTAAVDAVLNKHKIDKIDAIFISHTHLDHVMDMPYVAKKCDSSVYGSKSALNVARGGNVEEKRLHLFDLENPVVIGDFTIRVFKSLHSAVRWFNNDLGMEIEEPLVQPAKKGQYKEGGSYDFLVEHKGKNYLIRPSFNYIPGELDGIHADYAFLGIAGLSAATPEIKESFYKETIEKVNPSVVIPLHWDDFFRSLMEPTVPLHMGYEDSSVSLRILDDYCHEKGIEYLVLEPLTEITV